MKICKICKDRISIAKEKCNRCYYAVKRGCVSDFIKIKDQNFKRGGSYFLNRKFIVDKDDFEKLNSYFWVDNGNGYARNPKLGYLHRVICPQYKRVDHINQNKLDNRKINLREGLYINILNTEKREIPKLIHKNKQGKWYARTQIEGQRYYLKATRDRNSLIPLLKEILTKHNRLEFYNVV